MVGRADVPLVRVYASDQAHSSRVKAAVMLGRGEANVVRDAGGTSFRRAGQAWARPAGVAGWPVKAAATGQQGKKCHL